MNLKDMVVMAGISEEPTLMNLFQFLCANMLVCALVYFVLRMTKLGDRAWYLTVYSSGVASSFGIYFIQQAYLNGIYNTMTTETEWSTYAAIFFLAYCAMDLVIGSYEYDEAIDYKDGWVHHFFFIILLGWLLSSGLTGLFAIALIEEVPTVILSMARVSMSARVPFVFGLTFFVLRISYHCYLTYAVIEYSTVAFVIGVILMRSHLKWFHRWLSGHLTKKGRMPLSIKVAVFAALIVLQTIGHGYAVYQMVIKNYLVAASGAVMVHLIIFLYFSAKMIMVIQDVYTQNFIFEAIKEKKVIYNISWEDPRVDHQVLKVTDKDVVLTISSAGCNVLDYMIEGPGEMVAVDFNAAQLCVLELKILCIKYLNWEQFWQIWSCSNYELFKEVWPKLRKYASDRCKEFWDENGDLIRDNFMFAGTSGLMAKILSFPAGFIGLSNYMRQNTGKPFKGSFVFNMIVKFLSSSAWIPVGKWLAPLGGVPEKQLNLVMKTPGSCAIFAAKIGEIFEKIMWEKDNYFYYAYVAGRWDEHCCPRYMMKKHFKTLRDRVDRITLFHGSVCDAVKAMPQKSKKKFTVYSLLDSMDWMPESMVANQIGTITDEKYFNREDGRIFWRSFATGDRAHSPVLQQLNPTMLPDTKYPDRVGWYLTQLWTPKLDKKFNNKNLLIEEDASNVKQSFKGDLKVMWTMATYGLTQKDKDAKEFYKTQADVYDGFREGLLPDRDNLLQYVVPWTTSPKTWVSVGCGTARDIEYVVKHVKENKTNVYLCDLSKELLGIARDRVKSLGLTPYVTFVEGDINKAEVQKKLPPMGSIDLVTCSYCLTMIPPWKKAANTMIRMLRKGGHLAIVDFTAKENCQTSLDQRFYKFWFSMDGVWLNEEQPSYLRDPKNGLETQWYQEDGARVPYTFFYPTHYQFLGRKK
mmetsp:Transcript_12659/g.17663  ORF Transcript_12659/g.17663 Transcript_12659/m.17663 type:complete len:917 (-) Transcript_12659:430-3180(-)|eukprot:jgi/Bigna1/89413/estExt_fgenesh1_pg.C_490010